MPDFDRKRKFQGDQNHRPKKPHRDNPKPPSHTNVETSINNGLPPLPQIHEKYRSVVFTHPSQAPGNVHASYDRLEFLGDAYLELFATQLIFDRFPSLDPGKMSQIRESLVRNETIGQYASLYGLDKQIQSYKQFQNQAPHAWLKIKGDVFEAYVAAVILTDADEGRQAKKWLHQLWDPKLQAALNANNAPSKKSKEELAKKILAKGVKINYVDEKEPVVHYGQGKETYFIGVYLTGWGWDNQYLGSGKGSSRVEAGQAAAAAALSNRPLIDEIAAKKAESYVQRDKEHIQVDEMENV
ncbi:uncharacterized protein PV07_09727 [Cladophialophora immunda]|uniref:RNase III domain-containing protein n=1 Tax=Cladophialophora immunda TaxID=569365 RepID=A0A0D2AGJ1_9EURO|nr:uncharacterized protein PV07_09727 [Cladophialophora immunda]KIW23987.1 hypothetical protein PV07_09727 [Cladophialophora immunda]OQV01880.1 Ribonuclease III domain-containing protein [Cladophialophora immunda]